MSEQIAHSAVTRMNLREQFIHPHYAGFANDLMMMATTNADVSKERFLTVVRSELCEAYGFSGREQSKPFAFANGIAIIPVHGSLINRYGGYCSYVTGYNFIRSQFNAAMLDEDVTHVVFDHNSYGGEAAGCFELAAEIAAARGTKPIIAVVDSNCYSASFALASACDKIIAIPSAGVGSIGVVAMHVDMSGFLDKFGVKVTFIHSGDHKVDGNPYEKLPASVKADIQKGVDKSRASFVSLVAQNRGMDEKVVYDTEARTYRADEAKTIGLVDAIAVPRVALQSMIDGGDADEQSAEGATTETTTEPEKENAMGDKATEEKAVDTAALSATAASNERARVSAILNSEEAKANPGLANHFAFETSMSADDAKKAMKASAPAAAAAPAAEQEKSKDKAEEQPAGKQKATGFEKAMADAEHPNVTAENGGDGKGDAAARILANYGAMTGQTFDTK